jgi:hypothetical protein
LRVADCETDHYLVVAKVRERLAANKQAALKFDLEGFNLRNLSELEIMKHYQIKISMWFSALENLHVSEDIHGGWENIKENPHETGEANKNADESCSSVLVGNNYLSCFLLRMG